MNSDKHLRDVFKSIIKRVDDAIKSDDAQFLTGALLHIRSAAKHMLLLPPRNCDVGTAEEQEARFNKFCNSHYNINNVDGKCGTCPLKENRKAICEFAWLQMPYEEVKK